MLIEVFICKKQTPYWIIGVSKLMCVGCHTVIAKAYPQVLEEHPDAGLKPSAVHGCHGKLYQGWAAPNLSFEQLDFNLNGEVRIRAENLLLASLKVHVAQRRLSDSSISASSDKETGNNTNRLLAEKAQRLDPEAILQ
ncbi:hypothetical protein BT96DRAFT_929973 [Gymnopus androsaceus JB14]|uniref:Uncharacterized protein n=1 Tax=Gymnopus androsaceus JB14 TaxID=1447944 RepID=A0A6A4GCI4_9AGAR|nr:hypothetical protein BT96DRAFT_929973 [Gymnopus androsaceus JB14]